MGLFGKSFTSKIKNMDTLAVSRIAVLKNQHKARAFYARSDVAQLLSLGYHDHALLRVEHWIKEQNMLDVFVMVENYCNFLRERAELLEKNKECPDELKEATSSLIFASSRCGEFPELHKIQEMLTSNFGKEFADQAIELHRNNRVNTKMIQKLSKRCPDMEIRMKALKQIATEIGVTLHLEQEPILTNVNKLNADQRQGEVETKQWSSVNDPKHEENTQDGNIIQDEDLSDGNQERKGYKDRADAAQEALESESFGSRVSEHSDHRVALGKVHVHPMKSSSSKPEDEVVISKSNHGFDLREMEGREMENQLAGEESPSSQNPRDNMKTSRNTKLISNVHVEKDSHRQGNMLGELSSAKSFLMDNNNDHNNHTDAAEENEPFSEERTNPSYQARRWNPQRSQADPIVNPIVKRPLVGNAGGTYFSKQSRTHHEHVDWKMMSVRTR